MALTPSKTAEVRDRLYKLAPNNRETYEKEKLDYLTAGETRKHRAYNDATGKPIKPGVPKDGKITVGLGFNMDREEARKEWNAAFKEPDGSIAVDFDEVYLSERALTDAEIDRLYNYAVNIREKELIPSYGRDVWNKLKPNERLAIESAYYNKPKVVRGGSDVQRFIKDYIRTGDPLYFKQAEKALLKDGYDNTSSFRDGIISRRKSEAAMLASYECPSFTKEVILGETILRRGTPGLFVHRNDLYIWRTKGDGRVRKTHQENEGKLFLKSSPPPTKNPGEDYGCRCNADHRIPVWIRIKGIKVKSEYNEAFLKVKCALENLEFTLQEHKEEEESCHKDSSIGAYGRKIVPAIFQVVS